MPRIVDTELRERLGSAGAVVIEGPKACGKTETARQVAASEVLFDVDEAARQAVRVDPSLVLEGEWPRLLDEWQVEPALWNHVRRAVDAASGPGQFVLTGSAVPADDLERHTGAGRFSFLRMRPMALFESGHSSGEISLRGLLAGAEEPRSTAEQPSVAAMAERITVGGWPANQELTVDQAARAARDYLHQVRQVDISRIGDKRRNPDKVGALLRSLARNVATEVTNSTLASDAGGAEGPLSEHTVADYLSALQRLMIIEDQPAWAPHLRSKAVLRKSPKRHFVDPSLAVAALGTNSRGLLDDLNLLGLLFESLVVRDLRILSQALAGTVHHYRDHYGVEVDAIVQVPSGRWGAFEIKLGQGLVEEGAQSLHRFVEQVDTDKSGEPSVLGVICSDGLGYRREDGVAVIPVGALAP